MVISPKKFLVHFEFASSASEPKLGPLSHEVLQEFSTLPPLRLLCFIDTLTFESLQQQGFFRGISGPVAGIHTPIIGAGSWPHHVSRHFLKTSGEFAFDDVIYIPESRYIRQKVPFVFIFAHELQHFVQRGLSPKVSKANALLFWNLTTFDPTTEIKPWELPNNREAMMVAKRVAEAVCGVKAVRDFCEEQFEEGKYSKNLSKTQLWAWVRSLPKSASYDLIKETDHLVQKYRPQLTALGSSIDFTLQYWWL